VNQQAIPADSTAWYDCTPEGSRVKVFKTMGEDPAIQVEVPVLAPPRLGETMWVMRQLVLAGIPFIQVDGRVTKALQRGKFTWKASDDGASFIATWHP